MSRDTGTLFEPKRLADQQPRPREAGDREAPPSRPLRRRRHLLPDYIMRVNWIISAFRPGVDLHRGRDRVATLLPSSQLAVAAVLLLTSCSDNVSGSGDGAFNDLQCSISESELFSGGPGPDGIPSLQNPEFVAAAAPGAAYLRDTDRVVGFLADGEAWAVPHNIGWWHEIVNLDFPSGLQLAVTYCPLTGSSLTFDREAVRGATLGVSGLLFQNNLVMFDRNDPSSLWFQMMRGSRCGPDDGTRLSMHPSIETTWAGWQELYPDTRVVSGNLQMGRNYQLYPYGDYEETPRLLFPQGSLDSRRFVKERTLGIPEDDGRSGILFPFDLLRNVEAGPVTVATTQARGGEAVVFWDERVEGAMAFRPVSEGMALTFHVDDDRIIDAETGSEWQVDGVAKEGELAGRRLDPIPEAYVAFWFAWVAFHPEAELWEG